MLLNMSYPTRFVYNLIGSPNLVRSASVEINNILNELYNGENRFAKASNKTIISANKNNIIKIITSKKYDRNKYFINKYCVYLNESNVELHSKMITDLSRHIKNYSPYSFHPWNLHICNSETKYISKLMESCGQINCVYPLNAPVEYKQNILNCFF